MLVVYRSLSGFASINPHLSNFSRNFISTSIHLFCFLADEAIYQKLPTAIDYSDITEVADEDESELIKYRDAMATMVTACEGVYPHSLLIIYLSFTTGVYITPWGRRNPSLNCHHRWPLAILVPAGPRWRVRLSLHLVFGLS